MITSARALPWLAVALVAAACAAPVREVAEASGAETDEPGEARLPGVGAPEQVAGDGEQAEPVLPAPGAPIDRGQCDHHALEPGDGPRPGHAAAYEPDAVLDARAERLEPPQGAPVVAGARCVEAQNPQGELGTGCGGTNCAWQYVPSMTYRLERVELHSSSTAIALLDDDCGRPGRVLGRAQTGQGNAPGWVSGRFEQPVDVREGHVYWLWHSAGSCSYVGSGARQIYWADFPGGMQGPWEGPWRAFAWTARMFGTCL